MKQCQTLVTGDPCGEDPEQRNRSFAQEQPTAWEVGTPSSSGGADLAEIWQGRHIYLHFMGKHSLSTVFLPVGHKCSTGGGRFEPVCGVGMKFIYFKTALLLALTTAKRVSDLPALFVSPSCLQWEPRL